MRSASSRRVESDDLLRDAHDTFASIFVMLSGQAEPWDAMGIDERCARAANEAQQAFLRLEARGVV